jgi:protein TonB
MFMPNAVHASSLVPEASRSDPRMNAHRGATRAPHTGGLPIYLSIAVHLGLAAFGARYVRAARAVTARPAIESAIEVSTQEQVPVVLPVAPGPAENVPQSHPSPATHMDSRPVSAAVSAADVERNEGSTTAPDVVVAQPTVAAPRFSLAVASVMGNSSSAATTAAFGVGSSQAASAGPLVESEVDTPAKLLRGASPAYTAAAQAAGIEADVPFELVVDEGGSVHSSRPLVHVGYGLDEAALGAVRGYRFTPARRAGKSVAVRMRWVVRFELR